MRHTVCSAFLHLRTRALPRPAATIDSSEPAVGGLDKTEGFVKDTRQDLAKHIVAVLLDRGTRSCSECAVIRPVITPLGGSHHSNRCLLPNSKTKGLWRVWSAHSE